MKAFVQRSVKGLMPLTTLLAAICLATVFASADDTGNAVTAESKDTKPLVILPAGASDYKEYRINTQKKALQKDGGVHDVYVTKRPSKGKIFVTVILHVSTLEKMTVTGKDIVLSTPINHPTLAYTPFDWFVEEGASERRSEEMTLTGKAIFNVTFEVPLAGRDELVLGFRSIPLGTLGDIKKVGPAYL